ncbi:metallophosphoesterase [Nocardioides mesophilus]|uniref:Metallophosphoesterase n=1 Tax=Nocardioides mesophilus TaxID=433659 RepID=A0A7G9R9K0_9ACTN|nr:metallophosphoesterase [Nocardioides mesophilus]QNN52275.1 metallophosphoesterase [Nocardioides mesophilus]
MLRLASSLASGIAFALMLTLGGCATGAPEAGGPSPDRSATVAGTESSAASAAAGSAADGSFTFGAGGDLGANDLTSAGLAKLDASDARFFLALGDLDYDQTASDSAWCDYVTAHLPTKGAGFPFELVSGNHEADGGPDGRVANMAACLGDKLGSAGTYAAQYTFRYPATDPLAAVIMISPRLKVGGHTYDYRSGTADRAWLVRKIDRARAAGIPWVIVGMHYPCFSTGRAHGCDAGAPVMNLLVRKRVDLLLVGHNHLYERSKQIRLRTGCTSLRAGHFDRDCVVDNGADNAYRAGRGLVQVTSGRVGGRYQGIDPNDPDRRWFVKAGDRTTGWTKVAVTPRRLTATYVNTSGGMQDTFTID